MSILIVVLCIVILFLLIGPLKVNAFLAFLLVSLIAGFMLGIDPAQLPASIQKGVGDMLGSVAVIIVCGAMLGKLVAESGAAERIATGIMSLFGPRYIQWALVVTGFIIGIPLFYTVGFVLVMPLVFTVVYRYKLPAVFVGLPVLAALSVTHGFLPPHPSPSSLIKMFHANMGITLGFGVIIAIPTVIIAGPVFSKLLKNIKPLDDKTFEVNAQNATALPGLFNSVISSLLPVILLATATILLFTVSPQSPAYRAITFFADPSIVLLASLLIATFTLGVGRGLPGKKVMDIYADAVKDIGMLLLIISGAGALKQVLVETSVAPEIAAMLTQLDLHPLVLGWIIASVIRVCVGSATVAGLTAASIMQPVLEMTGADPNLMVLSIGAGSLMFSHVNDAGFWLYKEYLNLSIKDTIRSWSMMETIVAVCGLVGVMILNTFVS